MSASDPIGRFPSVPPLPTAPAAERESVPAEAEQPSFNWRTNLLLFLLTIASVFYVGQDWTARPGMEPLERVLSAWKFAVPLLAILVTHELGHYVAARLHRVPASLPYFLPLPVLNPFGTLGAIIVMPRRIRSARALLDIGAAGPLAGMAVAIPIMILGLSLSTVAPRGAGGGIAYIQEGQSLLYAALKYLVFGPIAPTEDVHLHPTALAAWVGFLVTFLNLIPFGQLDGGHVAYALLGGRQNRIARFMPFVLVAMALYNAWVFLVPILVRVRAAGFGSTSPEAWFSASAVTVWLTLLLLLWLLRRAAGADHPPVDDAVMTGPRKAVAVFTLLLFVALFMPSPWVVHQQLGTVLPEILSAVSP
jgi:membrane-associated protease RseP (regulator of RpoE activity)